MLIKKRFYNDPLFKRRAFYASLALIYLFAFRGEIWLVLVLIGSFLSVLLRPNVVLPLNIETFRAMLVLIYSLGGVAVLFYAIIYVISYFVLPVQTHAEHLKVYDRLLLYIKGKHGPATFIKDGAKIASPEEMNKRGPGVILVGMNSAIVLERKLFFSPASAKVNATTDDVSKKAFRVEGPGIVFTGGETIRKVVDLRNQNRVQPNVLAMTRDGIEVSALVFTLFSLSQPPPLLQVTYDGGESAEKISVITVDEKVITDSNGKKKRVKYLKEFSDELDLDDKQEIHRFIQRTDAEKKHPPAPPPASEKPGKKAAKKPPAKKPARPQPTPGAMSPYKLDKDRIFAAILSQPLEKAQSLEKDVEKRYVDWRDLPPRIAADIFRNLIAKYYYDALFQPESASDFPLGKVRGMFMKLVRNQGMMSFQVVRRKGGGFLTKDYLWNPEELEILPPRNFETPKMLRARGLVVIAAGFSEFKISDRVKDGLLDYWRSSWKREKEETLAQQELNALRVVSAERAKVQRDMAYTFAKLMQSSEYSREALAWNVYQSLEAIAADPETRKLLPDTTRATMENLRNWLMPPNPPPIEALPPPRDDDLPPSLPPPVDNLDELPPAVPPGDPPPGEK